MQEKDLIRESNPAKLYFEPNTRKAVGAIVMQGANPKVRLYRRYPGWIWVDVPLFI